MVALVAFDPMARRASEDSLPFMNASSVALNVAALADASLCGLGQCPHLSLDRDITVSVLSLFADRYGTELSSQMQQE